MGNDVNGLGQRIREARSRLGWSQNELASRAGVKQPTLQRIEAGLRLDPSIRTVAALAGALGCSLDGLLELPAPQPMAAGAPGHSAAEAIGELTRHIADVEKKLDERLRSLEEIVESSSPQRRAT